MRTRGLYDPLISREASTIWPIRQTRGVNRGYRDQFFRPDDSSVTIQGVGTPVVYRGDRLPKELYGDAFITDSTTNLVHRYKIVDDGTGRLKAVDGYDKGEILASYGRAVPSGEHARPAPTARSTSSTCIAASCRSRSTGPTSCATTSRRATWRSRCSLGRIWRIVHDTTKRDRTPALSKAPPAELVQTLSHPNGWWRDTAQQLLVQRGDASVGAAAEAAGGADRRTGAPGCTRCGRSTGSTRSSRRRCSARSRQVRRTCAPRRSGCRSAGSAQPNHPLAAAGAQADGRRELDRPPAARGDDRRAAGSRRARDAAVTVLTRTAAIRSPSTRRSAACAAIEGEVLTRVMQAPAQRQPDAVSMLAGAVARSGDVAAVQQVVAQATDAGGRGSAIGWRCCRGSMPGLPSAAAAGAAVAAGAADAGCGAGASRWRCRRSRRRSTALRRAEHRDRRTLAKRGRGQARLAGQAGAGRRRRRRSRPTSRSASPPARRSTRASVSAAISRTAAGKEKLAPSPGRVALYRREPTPAPRRGSCSAGKEGPIGLMPPLGGALNDDQIAAVLTYVRREWGNTRRAGVGRGRARGSRADEDAHAAVDGRGAGAGGWARAGGVNAGTCNVPRYVATAPCLAQELRRRAAALTRLYEQVHVAGGCDIAGDCMRQRIQDGVGGAGRRRGRDRRSRSTGRAAGTGARRRPGRRRRSRRRRPPGSSPPSTPTRTAR